MVHTHWQPNDFVLDLFSGQPKFGYPFEPSIGDVSQINRFNMEGLILTNRSIMTYTSLTNYTNHWSYPMFRYFPLHWWF